MSKTFCERSLKIFFFFVICSKLKHDAEGTFCQKLTDQLLDGKHLAVLYSYEKILYQKGLN